MTSPFPRLPVRYDRLTLEDAPGRYIYTSRYPYMAQTDPAEAARWIALLRTRGYTHWGIEPRHIAQGYIPGDVSYDLLDDPAYFLALLQPVFDAGFWVFIDPLPEGLSRAQYDFAQDMSRFGPFWAMVGPHPQVMGITTRELSEYMTAGEIFDFTRIVHVLTPNKPIYYHFATGEWYPRDYPMRPFWAEVERLHPGQVAISVQYSKTKHANGGFLATPETVRRETGQLRTEYGLRVLAGEYGHKMSERYTRPLGQVALDAGAEGFFNGGPGLMEDGMPVSARPFSEVYDLIVKVLNPWAEQYARTLTCAEGAQINSMAQMDGATDTQVLTWLRGHLGVVYPDILVAPDPF